MRGLDHGERHYLDGWPSWSRTCRSRGGWPGRGSTGSIPMGTRSTSRTRGTTRGSRRAAHLVGPGLPGAPAAGCGPGPPGRPALVGGPRVPREQAVHRVPPAHADATNASTAAAIWLQAPSPHAPQPTAPPGPRSAPEPLAPTTPTSQRQKREATTATTPSRISRVATPQDEPTNGAIMGMLQQMMEQSAQAQTDTHAIRCILHSRADTMAARLQQLADATDHRFKDKGDRMTNAELAAVPDDRTAQNGTTARTAGRFPTRAAGTLRQTREGHATSGHRGSRIEGKGRPSSDHGGGIPTAAERHDDRG